MISILTPTRGRPENVRRLVNSVLTTAKFPDEVELLFYVDFDDETFPTEIQSSNVRVIRVNFSRKISQAAIREPKFALME